GLLVYWITTNFWTVGQGMVVRKLAPNPNLATAGAGAGSGGLPTGARAATPERRRKPQDRAEDGASGDKNGAPADKNGAPREKPARAAAPPPPPRKKKKRSGRRR